MINDIMMMIIIIIIIIMYSNNHTVTEIFSWEYLNLNKVHNKMIINNIYNYVTNNIINIAATKIANSTKTDKYNAIAGFSWFQY